MSSIVPFSPLRVANFAAAGSPYGRAGYAAYRNRKIIGKAGQFMWKHRKSFVSMAKKRKHQRQDAIGNRAGIGSPVNQTETQRDLALNGNTADYSTRTPYANELTLISKSDDGLNAINDRRRNTIVVTGFKISYMYQNNVNEPMYCNIAIVNPKNANSSVMSVDGFFRDYNLSRDVNFSTGLSAMELHNLPISTDKYRILAHKRHIIMPAGLLATSMPTGAFANVAVNASGPVNMVAGNMWVPLKRQLQFNDDTDDNCEHKCFYVVWFDKVTASKTDPALTNVVRGNVHAVTYFNEVPQRNYRYNSFRYDPVKITQTV